MNRLLMPAISFLLGFWISWAAAMPVWHYFGGQWPVEKLGQWGDSFGALNSLFAGFAAVGVTATLYLQRQTMKEQKRDQSRQRFEGHFFQLLALSRELKQQIFTDTEIGLQGYEAVAYYARVMRDAVKGGIITIADKNSAASTYNTLIHEKSEAGLGAYFRVLFNILRLIDDEEHLDLADRELYGNLLRAQLSSDDLVLIGFNALTAKSGTFSFYVKKYRVLRYIPGGEIRSIFLLYYGDEALMPRVRLA